MNDHIVVWSSSSAVFASWLSITALALLVGLLVLSTALMFLMRTRFGEARPIVKCAILSVWAHLLLLIYACSTNFFDYVAPSFPSAAETTMQIVLLDEAELLEEEITPSSDDAQIESEPTTESPSAEQNDTTDASTESHAENEPLEPEPLPEEVWHNADIEHSATAVADDHDTPVDQPAELASPLNEQTVVEAPTANSSGSTLADPLDQPPPLPPLPDEFADEEVSTVTNQSPSAASSESTVPDSLKSDSVESPVATRHEVTTKTNPFRQSTVTDARPIRTVSQRERKLRIDKYAGRKNLRRRLAGQGGPNGDAEAAVVLALKWLAATQDAANGKWDASEYGAGRGLNPFDNSRRNNSGLQADNAITGLALLAFLGAGHTHREGEYRKTVQRGLEFLLRSQSKSSGSLAGSATAHAKMYCHGIATLALSEAYAMTRDDRIRPFLDRAIRYSIACQNPATGGWRYRPGEEGDTSQFGWQLMALTSARNAGLNVSTETMKRMQHWLDLVSSGRRGGLASYRPRQQPSATMTAEALVCRLFLEEHQDHQSIDEAATYVAKTGIPNREPLNLYYCYYATVGLFQMQDDRWESWNRQMQSVLLSRQRRTGPAAGSWDPNTAYGRNGGRVYTTALATLCLETGYRYLPFYERPQDRTARLNARHR